jgi:hypothetical protein
VSVVDRLHQLVYWYTGEAQGPLQLLVRDVVRRAWEDGELPARSYGKRWVAGYRVTGSFFGSSCTEIRVGPKPPSHFKDSYARVKYDRKGWIA